MKKTAIVLIAEGFEEIEAVTSIDVLRRAGAEVTVAGLGEGAVRGSRGVRLLPDVSLEEVSDREFELVVLPGGMPGATNLAEDARVRGLVEQTLAGGRSVGAICAAPAVVLSETGLLGDRKATCHPGLAARMREDALVDARVHRDGNVITSKGPGTAMEFALSLVAHLFGEEKAEEVNGPMYARYP